MKKLLLGSRNTSRKEYVKEILKGLDLEILSLNDIGVHIKAVEDGKSPTENSIKKATTYFEQAQLPTLSIDAGLYIEKFAENKQPGVFVRRIYGKEEVSDEEMLNYYIEEIKKCGGESKACWKIAITLVKSDNEVYTTTYKKENIFVSKRCKEFTKGEPLNSMQMDPKSKKYLAQMTVEEKKLREKGLSEHIYKFVEMHIE